MRTLASKYLPSPHVTPVVLVNSFVSKSTVEKQILLTMNYYVLSSTASCLRKKLLEWIKIDKNNRCYVSADKYSEARVLIIPLQFHDEK